MITIGEVFETNEMIWNEHLDVRTITLGISLLDCITDDLEKLNENIYKKITETAKDLVKTGDEIGKEFGIPIVNKRISVTPIAIVGNSACKTEEDFVSIAKTLDRAAVATGVNFIGGYSALVCKGSTPADKLLIRSIPRALKETEHICSSINLGSTRTGINMDAVKLMGEIIKEAAELTKERDSIGCAKLVVFCNAPDDNPFMAGAFHGVTEADKIIRLVDPVKNLFGAVFFVSVGMLVDPQVLIDYALPILFLVLTILIGQALFGTLGYLLGGQTLKNAMRCGFSMAQIGEFAFIIASLGLSLHVISDYLYPVVVAVSVITTFLTPYMIRAAEPMYNLLIKHLPKRWVRRLTHIQDNDSGENAASESQWKSLLKSMLVNTLIYGILSSAVIALMFSIVLPICRKFSVEWTGSHWAGNAVCGLLTVAFISPFLRAIVMKRNHSEAFKALWTDRRINRLPLIATGVVRVIVAVSFIFYICNYLTRFQNALMIAIAFGILTLIILSRRLKKRSIKLERLFVQNLRSREIEAQVHGRKKPLFADHLIDRDIHIANIEVPEDSSWAGKTLQSLRLRNRFGVHVSSILRGSVRINIPNGGTIVFPEDKLQVIGNDEQLTAFSTAVKSELIPEDIHIEEREMKLRCFKLSSTSPFIGKTLKESGIRDQYNCMVVGVDEGQKNLTLITPSRCLQAGDVLWIVGEEHNLETIQALG